MFVQEFASVLREENSLNSSENVKLNAFFYRFPLPLGAKERLVLKLKVKIFDSGIIRNYCIFSRL